MHCLSPFTNDQRLPIRGKQPSLLMQGRKTRHSCGKESPPPEELRDSPLRLPKPKEGPRVGPGSFAGVPWPPRPALAAISRWGGSHLWAEESPPALLLALQATP